MKLGEELVRGRFAGMDREGRLAAGYRGGPAPDHRRRVAGPRGLKETAPCCSPSTSATPTPSSRVFDGDELVGAMAPAHRGQPHRRRVRRLADPAHAPEGLRSAGRSRARSSPASCRAVNSTCAGCARPISAAAAGRRRAGLRSRHQGADRPAAGCRRRPRWSSVVAGNKRYGGPLVIVDFGSATTFDMVDDEGSYRRRRASRPASSCRSRRFYLMTAELPRIAVEKPEKRDRQGHHPGHAVRRVLGLCRADRGLGQPHQRRIRQADDRDRHRRPGAAVFEARSRCSTPSSRT